MTLTLNQQRTFTADVLTTMLEQQVARHLLNNNGHIISVLRYQARTLGLTLNGSRINHHLPHPWTIRDFEKANARARKAKRRAKTYFIKGPHFTGYDWLRLYAFYNHRCLACGAWHGDDITIDHVVPMGAGGSNRIENVQPLCRACHDVKERIFHSSGLAMDYRESLPPWVEGK